MPGIAEFFWGGVFFLKEMAVLGCLGQPPVKALKTFDWRISVLKKIHGILFFNRVWIFLKPLLPLGTKFVIRLLSRAFPSITQFLVTASFGKPQNGLFLSLSLSLCPSGNRIN